MVDALSLQVIYDTIAQAGGEVISADQSTSGYGSPEALAGVQYWLDFIDAGWSPTVAQMVETQPWDMFMAGKVAMIYSGSFMTISYSESGVADDIQVAPMPSGPAGNQSVVHGLSNVAKRRER